MVTKGAKNTSGVKARSHVRGLVGDIKVSELGDIIVEEQYVAGLDVAVDHTWFRLLMEELQPSSGTHGNPHPLHP